MQVETARGTAELGLIPGLAAKNQSQSPAFAEVFHDVAQRAADNRTATTEPRPSSAILQELPTLLGRFPGPSSTSPPTDNVVRVASVRDETNAIFEQFERVARHRYAEAGVDSSQPIRLTSDTRGHVKVAAEHPDRAKIEQIFEDDPDLANTFRYLSGTYSLLNAVEEAQPFRELYAKEPDLALARYAYLFDPNRAHPEFSLLFSADSAEVQFS